MEHIEENKLRLNGRGNSEGVASNKFRFEAGDILFGKLRPYFRKVIKPDFDGICSTDIWVVNPKNGVDESFLFYFFANKEFVDLAYASSGGTRMPRADWNFLKETKWPVPPLPEQRAITSVLSSLDDKINLLRRQNATLESLAETLFRQWFVEEAEEDWEWIELGQLIEVHRGLSYKGAGLAEEGEGVPMHNLNSVLEGGGYKYGGIKFYSGDYKDRHTIAPGDVMVTNTEQGHDLLLIGYPAIVPKFYGDYGIFSQHIYKLEIKNTILSEAFLYYLLMTFDVREQITGATNGSTVNMLPKDGIEWAKFKLPPESKIQKFTQLARQLIEKKEANFVQSKQLEKLRDTLLPKLMSGEVQVKTDEKKKKPANIIPIKKKQGNPKFREAILISAIVREFYTSKIGSVSRQWYQKISYLHKRKMNDESDRMYELLEEYGKKAAGPYKREMRYHGPEGIAVSNGYLESVEKKGFKPAQDIDKIDKYFIERDYWIWELFQNWTLPNLKYKSVKKLGVWTTVDYCLLELNQNGKELNTENVLQFISESKEWKHKLKQPEFSPENVEETIQELFGMYNY